MTDLLYTKRDGVAHLTLNRPERHNALTPESVVRLADAWADFSTDPDARVAIITGAGDRAFCAGADLGRLVPLLTRARDVEDEWDERLIKDPDLLNQAFLRGVSMTKPVIAAVNGLAIAGGTEIALATDIRVVVNDATFGLFEVRRGLIPAGGSLARLARQIPYAKAMEILLVGDTLDAAEAYRIGLVNEVVEREALMPRAEALATKIAANGPLAVRKVKEVVMRASGVPLIEGFAIEDECVREVMRSDDAREGASAFMEKRASVFTGR
jgi:enoyl-CoA hydratase/carnithine racemase